MQLLLLISTKKLLMSNSFKNPLKWKKLVLKWMPSMKSPLSKLMKRKRNMLRPSKILTKNITERPRLKSTPKTNILLALKQNASSLSKSTEECKRFAAGARKLLSPRSSGSGHLPRRSGTDSTMANGTTGESQRKASLMLDGPGGRDTGITMVTYSDTRTTSGIDSKEDPGSSTEKRSQSAQRSHMESQSADLSIDS